MLSNLQYDVIEQDGEKFYYLYSKDLPRQFSGFVHNPGTLDYWKVYFKGQEITINKN